jgi:hypothetical protein
MVSTEAFEARIASALDAVSRHMIGPHLGDQEYAIALTTDCAPNEFLGAVDFRRVDQHHSKREARK